MDMFEAFIPISFTNLEKFKGDINSVASELTSKLGSSLMSGLGVLGLAVGIGATVTKAIQSAMAGESHLQELKSALKSTGQEVEGNIAKFNKFAAAIAATTPVSKGQVKELIELGLKHSLSADQAERFTSKALGLAKATGIDAKEAMELLARGDERSLTALSRHSKEIDLAALKQGNFTSLNKLAARGTDELKDANQTAEAKWKKLGDTIDDLYKKFGTMLLPIVTNVIDALSGFFDWINDLIGATSEFSAENDTSWGGLSSWMETIKSIWDTVVSAYKEGYETLVYSITNWKVTAELAGISIALSIVTIYERAIWLGQNMGIVAHWIWDNFTDIFKTIVSYVTNIFKNLCTNIMNLWSAVLNFFKTGRFQMNWKDLTDGAKNEIKKMPEFTKFEHSTEMGKNLSNMLDQKAKEWVDGKKKFQDKIAANKEKRTTAANGDWDKGGDLGKGDFKTQSKGGGSFSGLADSWKKAQEGIMKSGADKKAEQDRKATRDNTAAIAKNTAKMANKPNYAVAHP